MENIKNVWKKIRKYWITVWLILAVLSLTAIVSYAAYTRVTVVKRVISTGEGAGEPFGSDLMSGSIKKIKRIPFSNKNDTPNISLNIFNYPYPKRSSCGRDETLYDLTVSLGTLDEMNNFHLLSGNQITNLGDGYRVVNEQTNEIYYFGSDYDVSHTFQNCSITGGNFNSNVFTLQFDPAELTDEKPKGYCMMMQAVPADSELPILTGYVLVKYTKTADSGWTGELEELFDETDYDGYNYIIKGNGKGEFTFKWDASKVTINQQFLHNSDITFFINNVQIVGNPNLTEDDISTDAQGFRTLTLIVDSSKKNRYDVQFYKVNNTQDEANGYDNENMADYLPKSTTWKEN